MTAEQLANQIENIIIKANDAFGRKITNIQEDMYDDFVITLKKLELTPDGYIRQTADNRRVLREAQGRFDSIIANSGYSASIETHLLVLPKINDLNEAYFKTLSDAFKANRQFIRSLQTQTIETVNQYMLQDGLAAQVKIPLNEILNQNINSGGSFAGMQKQLEAFIKGTQDTDGRLLKYSKAIMRDTLFQYSRTFQVSIVDDLGLLWYRYVGGIIDKTRPFCSERNGGYFHQKEIESWASQEWAGKNPLTTESSIFTYLGGFNCIHQLIAVHESVVPKEWIDRWEA